MFIKVEQYNCKGSYYLIRVRDIQVVYDCTNYVSIVVRTPDGEHGYPTSTPIDEILPMINAYTK